MAVQKKKKNSALYLIEVSHLVLCKMCYWFLLEAYHSVLDVKSLSG